MPPTNSLARIQKRFIETRKHLLLLRFSAGSGIIQATLPQELYRCFVDTNLYELMPFLSSLCQELLASPQNYFFPHINHPIPQLNDIEIANIHLLLTNKRNRSYVCIVENLTQEAHWLQSMQQLAHDTAIMNELLQAKEQILLLEKENLQLRNEELLRLQQLKNQLYASIAHELRNPTQGIIGLTELIQEEHLSVKQTEYIKSIYRAAQHMQNLLNDFLNHAKLESGEISLVQEPFSVQDILNHLELSLLKPTQEKQLFLRIYTSASIPPVVVGDGGRLMQILYNLAGNAIKFTEKGGISIEAYLDQVQENNAWIRFEVKDTGIGIAAEHLEQIFQPYQQAHSRFAHRGIGLGLSIVKELTRRMGGKIEVKSQPNRGTSFTLLLPFLIGSPLSTVEENTNLSLPEHFHGIRALVVEDHAAIALYLQKILEKRGIHADHCNHIQQAKAYLDKHTYQIIFSDWHLQEENALPLLEYIQTHMAHRRPALVLLSADPRAIQDVPLQLFDLVVAKHFNETQFFQQLSPLLRRLQPFPRFISFDRLLEYAQNDQELLLSILDTSIPELERQLKELEQAYASKLIRRVAQIIHQLKPISHILGYDELIYHVEKADFIIKNQLNPHSRLRNHIKIIAELLPDVLLELKYYQKQLKSMSSV